MAHEESEIAKLTERIAKDPKSKLFVPLAEEYKKAGDMEMALHVLSEGLKNNPGYVTAKSFLGRLLIEKGNLAGAKKEFEEVVKAIPDNLLAQRKLGDINALQGNTAGALAHYKAALALTPKDEEISSLIADLQAGRSIAGRLPVPKVQPAAPAVPKQAAPVPKGTAPIALKGQVAHAPAPRPQAAVPEAEEPEEIFALDPITTEPAPEPPASKPDLAGPQPDFDFLAETAVLPEPEAVAPGRSLQHDLPGPSAAMTLPEDKDDLSTDTLAELYIGQGFYEKAIDIYERMAVENPGNAALRRKLQDVRAMAGIAPSADAGMPDQGHDAAGDVRQWSPAHTAGPDAEPAMPVAGSFPPPERNQGAVAQTGRGAVSGGAAADSRRQTVARLEHWLNNIMKEKNR